MPSYPPSWSAVVSSLFALPCMPCRNYRVSTLPLQMSSSLTHLIHQSLTRSLPLPSKSPTGTKRRSANDDAGVAVALLPAHRLALCQHQRHTRRIICRCHRRRWCHHSLPARYPAAAVRPHHLPKHTLQVGRPAPEGHVRGHSLP